ncbi:hypothetical protein ScPMuIL_001442 [Solemya velum]
MNKYLSVLFPLVCVLALHAEFSSCGPVEDEIDGGFGFTWMERMKEWFDTDHDDHDDDDDDDDDDHHYEEKHLYEDDMRIENTLYDMGIGSIMGGAEILEEIYEDDYDGLDPTEFLVE